MVDKDLLQFLLQEDTFSRTKKFAKDVLNFYWQDEAYAYVKNMEPVLEGNQELQTADPDKYQVYYDIYVKFKFLVLNRLSPNKLADFFQKHWMEQYDIPHYIDNTFIDLFDAHLLAIPLFEERDKFKKNILQALYKNEQLLVDKNIQTPSGPKRAALSVGSLLRSFAAKVPSKKIDRADIQSYIDELGLKYKLSEIEKRKISHLLNFFRELNTSSFEPEGIPEPLIFVDEKSGHLKVIKKGMIEDISNERLENIVEDILALTEKTKQKSPGGKSLDGTDRLLRNYRSVAWDGVIKQTKRLEKVFQQDKFLRHFHQLINSRNKEGIIASLLVLAKQGKLDEIFEIDEKIRDIFAQHLQKKFSEKLTQHFLQNLRDPVYISYFLQHLLKDILKLDENESAVIAIKLANELKRAGDKEYLAIAYGDLNDGTFKWKTIIEEDDKLTLANK